MKHTKLLACLLVPALLAGCGDGGSGHDVPDGGDAGDTPDAGDGLAIDSLALGLVHNCAVFDTGALRCWGHGAFGRLGYESQEIIGDDPGELPPPDVNLGGPAVQVAVGEDHTCAVLEGGAVHCWGAGYYGQLGHGAMDEIGDEPEEMPPPEVEVGGAAIRIAAGNTHSCALLDTGALRCWGHGEHGRLGNQDTGDVGNMLGEMPPADVDLGGVAVDVVAGGSHTCALLDSGAVRCFGSGGRGKLGYGNTDDVGDDEPPSAAGDVDLGGTAIQLVAGGGHTCALLDTGAVRCFGNGEWGQLGYGSEDNIGDDDGEMPPADVPIGGTAVALAAGSSHTCAVLDGGAVRCWGAAWNGQLGYGDEECLGDEPGELPSPEVQLGGAVSQIVAGGNHNCVVLEGGVVRCWGHGQFGNLGFPSGQNVGDDDDEMPPPDAQLF